MKKSIKIIVSFLFASFMVESITATTEWKQENIVPSININADLDTNETLMAHWKFDESIWNGTENEVKDETDNYNGTANGPVITTAGRFNNAGKFDGSNDYIDIGTTLSPNGDITVSAWIMSYGVTVSSQWYNDYIISKGNDIWGTTNSWGLHLTTEEENSPIKCSFMINTDQELTWVSSPYGTIEKNIWYFIAGVIKADTAYLYLDGSLVTKKKISGSIAQSNLKVNIGKMERSDAEYFFNGLIDEVKVNNRALSSEEIYAEYTGEVETFEITDVVITNLTATETKIEWSTTKPASGFIFYAEEDTTSGFPFEAMETGGNVTEHSLILNSLTTGANYYFIIDQNDADFNNVRSGTYSFVAGEFAPGETTPFDSALASMKKLLNSPDVYETSYYDGAFISKDVAYIVTSHNRLFKTSDGGNSWTDISPEQGTSFDSLGNTPRVHFINENIGTVAFSVDDGANGYDYSKVFGYVWCTIDGGETWSERFDVNKDQILHLQQVSETVVYVSGAASYGVSSNRWFKKITRNISDNSYTLTDITTTPSSRPHVMDGDWLDETTGVVLGKLNISPNSLTVFKTTDGGGSWNSIQSNLPAIEQPQLSFSDNAIQMIDENRIAFAYYYPVNSSYETRMWISENGGESWEGVNLPDANVFLRNINFNSSGEYGILSGYSPDDSSKVFYKTTDFGTSWESFLLPETFTPIVINATAITNDGTIWAIGNNNSIWKSTKIVSNIYDGQYEIPSEFVLYQNYPNPFNPTTVIEFSLSKTNNVTLKVYNTIGEEVATLINRKIAAGHHSVNFNASNLSSGIYFYRISSKGLSQTKKMIILK